MLQFRKPFILLIGACLPIVPALSGYGAHIVVQADTTINNKFLVDDDQDCKRRDLNTMDDEAIGAALPKCTYRFIGGLFRLLDEMVDQNVITTLKFQPQLTEPYRLRVVEHFRDYEWALPLIQANKELLAGFSHDPENPVKIEVIPSDIFMWIVDELIPRYLSPVANKTKPPYSALFAQMFGGKFMSLNPQTKVEEEIEIAGLLYLVKVYDLQSWSLIESFSDMFQRVLARKSTSAEISKTFQGLVNRYFEFMHPQNRLHILARMADLVGETAQRSVFMNVLEEENDREAKTAAIVHLFQNTGPVFIKLLQTLNEAIKGESILTPILAGIKESFPMPSLKVQRTLQGELARVMDANQFNSSEVTFREKPLGIASIAQANKFALNGEDYVVKIRKDKIDTIFRRERESIVKLMEASAAGNGEDEETQLRRAFIFDKGVKQRLNNYMESIIEEMNFNFERQSIIDGAIAFTDKQLKISVAEIPEVFKRQRSSDVLIMRLAHGKEIGKILDGEKGEPPVPVEDLKKALTAVYTLYEKFLNVALDPNQPSGFQFYHGDLHRGNFFVDLNTMKITLIDFGNAGKMPNDLSRQITKILINTQKTADPDPDAKNAAIRSVGELFYQIARRSLEKSLSEIEKSTSHLNVVDARAAREEFLKNGDSYIRKFFTVCFNPTASRSDRPIEHEKIKRKAIELKNAASQLKKQIVKSGLPDDDERIILSRFRLNLLADNIGLLEAIKCNCLGGRKYPITTSMAEREPVSGEKGGLTASDKLTIVFSELEKSGIGMPKEIALFNKSKGLLEGIMNNFVEKIRETDKSFVPPKSADEIFGKVVSELNGQRARMGR